MSPLKRKKLGIIRVELDKLDNSLIKIIKKRTNLVKKVLALKDHKSQIVDQKRIKTILKNIILLHVNMKYLWKKNFHLTVSNYFFLKFLFSKSI